MRMLAAADDDLHGVELLRFAVDQAVAFLGGLGGMAHLTGPSPGGDLRLIVASGLPPALTRAWEKIDEEDAIAPARAIRRNALVWSPSSDVAISPHEHHASRSAQEFTSGASDAAVKTAITAVPLLGPHRPVGALSVLTTSPDEPSAEHQAFLHEITRWVYDHMHRPADVPPRQSPAWWQEQAVNWRLQQTLQTVGAWDWDIRTGEVVWNDTMLLIFGLDPDAFDGRIESWTSRIHPDDQPWVLAEIHNTIRDRRAYRAEYRVCRPGGEPAWVQARGLLLFDTNGRPAHMIGTLTDTTETHVVFDVLTENPKEHTRHIATQVGLRRGFHVRQLIRTLAEAITVQDVAAAVADQIRPLFGASGLTLGFVEGDHWRPVAFAGYPKEFIKRISEKTPVSNLAVMAVINDRVPTFLSTAEEYISRYPDTADLMAAGGKQAWAFLPLAASGRTVGISVIAFDEPRQFTGEERNLLTTLSGLVAQALERARLYDAQRTRAQALQRELLPRTLPRLPFVTTAARYVPASKDMEVGGDWYDVIPLSAARVAFVIGDVMGHGVSEAATMGRLRTAVRTLADLELPPDEIITHLNDLVCDLGEDFYATCQYIVYDPTDRRCVLASAGHPPPAIVYPDSTVHFLTTGVNPPLGAATPPFDTVEMELPEGTVLLLYTDGLVESATLNIDRGMANLADVLAQTFASGAGQSKAPETTRRGDVEFLEDLCERLTTTALPARPGMTDDAAVLVVRTRAMPDDDIAAWSLPEAAQAARQAREHVRAQLATWRLEDLVMSTELLASELVGNVIRHAKGPIGLRLLRSDTLICEVSDGSLTTPRIRRASETDEGGRGLQLVAALSDRWGTRYTPTGKCIWTEQSLPLAPRTASARVHG